MEVIVKDSDVICLLLDFLYSRELYESALALERETGCLLKKDKKLPEDLLFLRQLALDGKWDLVLSYLEPFTHLDEFDSRSLYYLVLRQRYFEALHSLSLSKTHSASDTRTLKVILDDVRPYCSAEEFQKLCQARSHSDLHDWSVVASRFRCFDDILYLIGPLYEEENGGDRYQRRDLNEKDKAPQQTKLTSALIKSLLFDECNRFCRDRARGVLTPTGLEEAPRLSTGNLYDSLESVNAALFFWLRSLRENSLFQQPFAEEDIQVNLQHLKKRTTPRDILPTGSAKLSSFTSGKTDGAQMRSALDAEGKEDGDCEESRTPSDPSVTGSSLQFSRRDNLGAQHGAVSASVPARHRPYTGNRNFSNNNNRNSVDVTAPPSPKTLHSLVEKSGKSENTMVTEITPGSKGDAAATHEPPHEPTKVQEDKVNPVAVEKTKPVSGQLVKSEENHEKEIPAKKEITGSGSEMSSTSDKVPLYKGMREEGNDERELPETQHIQVKDSYADFIEEKNRLRDEKQKFLKELEEKERKNEEIRKTLLQSQNNLTSENIPASLWKPSASPDDNRSSRPIPHSPEQVQNGKLSPKSSSKSTYVPLEVAQDTAAVRAVSFHPSGLFYSMGSNSKTLRVCEVPVDIVQRYLGGRAVTDFTYDPASFVTKSASVLIERQRVHRGSIYCLAWNGEGSVLATGSNDKLIKLWKFDVLTKALEDNSLEMSFHKGVVRDLLFLQGKENILASGGADWAVYTTDCVQNKMLHRLTGHSDLILSLYSWHYSMLASSSNDKTIRLWDLRAPRCVSIIGAGTSDPCVPACVCVDKNERYLAIGQDNSKIGIYDLTAGKMVLEFKCHGQEVRSVRFNPVCGNLLLSSSYDRTVALTDVSALLSEIEPSTSVRYHTSVVAKCGDKVIQARWHPNGEDFATTSVDKTCKLWHRCWT